MKPYSHLQSRFEADIEVYEDIVDAVTDEKGGESPCLRLDLEMLWHDLPALWSAFTKWRDRIAKDFVNALPDSQKDEHLRFNDDFVTRIRPLFDRVKALTEKQKSGNRVDLLSDAGSKAMVEAFEKARRAIVATPTGADALDPEPNWDQI